MPGEKPLMLGRPLIQNPQKSLTVMAWGWLSREKCRPRSNIKHFIKIFCPLLAELSEASQQPVITYRIKRTRTYIAKGVL